MKHLFMKALICGMVLGTPLQVSAQYPHQTPTVYNGPHYNSGHNYNSNYILVPLVNKVYALPDAFYSSRTTYSEDQRDELIRMMSKLISIMEAREGLVGEVGTTKPKGVKGGRIVQALSGCVSCHSPTGGNKGGIDLSNPTAVSSENRVYSLRAVVEGSMPKGGGKVSKDNIAVIEKWAAGLNVD